MPHQLRGAEYGAAPEYVKVFISRLRAKIEPAGGLRYIESERGLGYRFVRPRGGADQAVDNASTTEA